MKVLPLLLFLVTLAAAQQQPVQARQAAQQQTKNLQHLALQIRFDVQPLPAPARTNLVLARPLPQRPSAIKSPSYLLMLATATASTIADCESTSALLSDPHNHEINPLFGLRPSRARIYGISLPILAIDAWSSAWAKRRGKRWWPVTLSVAIAVHGGAALHNGLQ